MQGRLVILLVAISGVYVTPAKGAGSSSAGKGKCFVPDKDRYQYFGSRTTYAFAHGTIKKASDSSCQPVQIWGLIRHGTKYPDAKTLPKIMNLPKLRDAILKNHEGGAGEICPADIAKLKSWKIDKNFDPKMDEFLAPQGIQDMIELAGRIKKAYPTLFDKAQPKDFMFRSTKTQRTEESRNAFVKGLFGKPDGANIVQAPEPDTLLKPFNSCPKWLEGKKNKFIYAQRDEFTKGPEVQKILKDVSTRFGFKTPITFEDFVAFYEACRFENALYLKQITIWCSLLTKSELEAMEYREDLRIFYYVGPGRPINAKMGCFPLKDMFERFAAISGAPLSTAASTSKGASSSGGAAAQPKGVFYFAHSKNIQALLSAFRVGFGDPPLKATGYASSKKRKFRTSTLGGFAGNFIAVLHKCTGNKFKATFHSSEHPVAVDSCKSANSCDLSELLKAYKKDIDTCSMADCK